MLFDDLFVALKSAVGSSVGGSLQVLRLLPREQWKAPQPRRAGRAVASAARGEEAEAMQAEEGAEEAVVDEDDEEEGEVAGEGRPEPSGEDSNLQL